MPVISPLKQVSVLLPGKGKSFVIVSILNIIDLGPTDQLFLNKSSSRKTSEGGLLVSSHVGATI